jgi:hypothetical protein
LDPSANPTTNITWPQVGIATNADWSNWDGPNGAADYVTHYWDSLVNGHTYNWSTGIQERNFYMRKFFSDHQPYIMLDRPQLMLKGVEGAYYVKQSGNDPYYNPLTDSIIQPGDIGPATSSGIMTAAALGAAGVRLYTWEDPNGTSKRAAYANGTWLQTGVNPITQEHEITANWNAISSAGNAIKILTPYLLAEPLNSPAYGRNIVSAVRQGTGGRMLLIVNDDDFKRTMPVDFTPFAYNGGAITKYLVGADLLTSKMLSSSALADTVTLDGGESVAYVFAP